MSAAAASHDLHYSAFLSYCRGDEAVARRIHRKLEGYRLPRRLQAHNDAWDPARRRLKPLFRDLDDMTAAPDINTAVQDAMAASRFMVVLCTPKAAKSEWVGREIAMFRHLHGDDLILAALVDGLPEEAFHPALLSREDGGGLLQPLAADFREEGDGPRLALLKLVAVMAGVGLGELVQRDAQRRMWQMGMWALGTVAVLLVVLAAVVVTMNARENAARERARTGAMSSYMLDQVRTNLKRYGSLGMLETVNRGVMETFRGRDLAGLGDEELQQLAKLRLAMGEDAEQRGDLAGARVQIAEARRTTAARLAAAPKDAQRIFDHAQSQYYVGLIAWRAGDRDSAEAAFNAYRDLAQRLLAIDSSNPDWWMEAGYAEANLGMYALRTTLDISGAEDHFRRALGDYAKVARLRPNDRDAASAITDAHAWLGDTLRQRGEYNGALASRVTQRRLLEAMRADDPRDRQFQGDLVANELAIARIAAEQGQWSKALASLASGREAASGLARDDPDNVRRTSQVRIFDLFTLRTWLAMPASARPTPATMAAMNGDCANDLNRLKNAELAEFCKILEARRLGTPLPAVAETQTDALSESWGLDFAKERAAPSVGSQHAGTKPYAGRGS